MDIPENFDEMCELFDSMDQGSGDKLRAFMDEAEYKYNVGIKDLVYKTGLSITELIRWDLISGVFKLQVFSVFQSTLKSSSRIRVKWL